jgi:triosephosphate isomerase (TIM)
MDIKNMLIIGNWKMFPVSFKEARNIIINLNKKISKKGKSEVVVCPPYPYVLPIVTDLKKTRLNLGLQDIHPEPNGAHTGSVSLPMFDSAKVTHVILGHSERRALGENNLFISQKIKSVLKSGITPVLCVGEVLRDEDNTYLKFIETQIRESLSGVPKQAISKVVIAYEPVWAIGKDAKRAATSEEAREMRIFIRKVISDMSNSQVAMHTRVIYGASVDKNNISSFIEAGMQGLLVGRVSLDPVGFSEIINSCDVLK